MDATHIYRKNTFYLDADSSLDRHASRVSYLHCELPDLLEQSRPPDLELVDLIEWAFLEGQIDSRKADLAVF